jgi:CHAD domain-containing protein
MSIGPKALGRRYKAQTRKLAGLAQAKTSRFTPEGIHDMRITARRLQVVMELLPKRVRKSADFRRFGRAIGNLLRATSGIRDIDTTAKTLESLRGVLPPEFSAGLAEERKSEGRKAEAAMNALLRLTPPVLGRKPVSRRKLSARLTKKARRRERVVESVLKKVLKDESRIKELHTLRIEVKKMRYLAELTKSRTRKVKALVGWQDALGRIRDIDVAIARLKGKPTDYSEVVSRLSQDRHLAYLKFVSQFEATPVPHEG